ncbi:MAG: aspartyl protease family protein [Bacteroidota bacterium]
MKRFRLGFSFLKVLTLSTVILITCVSFLDDHSGYDSLIIDRVQSKATIVPFNYVRKKIVVQVQIMNHDNYNFVVDSGIYPSVISKELAGEIGLTLRNKGTVSGYGSERNYYFHCSIPAMAVGQLEIRELDAVAMDLSRFDQIGVRVDGILGFEFLKRFATRIDFENYQLSLFQRLPNEYLLDKTVNEDYVLFPMYLDGGKIPKIQGVRIGDEIITAWIDTGAEAELVLSHRSAENLKIKKDYQFIEKRKGTGANGVFYAENYAIPSIEISSFVHEEVMASVFSEGGNNLIGNGLMEHYNVTLDYIGKRIFFEKRE